MTNDFRRAVPDANVTVASATTTVAATAGGVACYLAGTRIRTPDGDVPVETIHPGDLVVTTDTGQTSVFPVRWIGHRRIDVAHHRDPSLVQPIRILRDAIANRCPSRDLLVSPDHAILVQGCLVPTRLLVNGASIQIEDNIRLADYFHIELDRHALLLAENLEAESYLDTGNRDAFQNGYLPLTLHPDFAAGQSTRGARSCRPLVCRPQAVEALWRSLTERACLLGFSQRQPQTTADPDLCLAIGGGRIIRPTYRDGGRYVFVLPPRREPVRLASRAAVPSQVRPWLDDRRRLGVMISRLELHGRSWQTSIAMDDPGLCSGWWAPESDGTHLLRWTDGMARLTVPEPANILTVTVAQTLPYQRTPARQSA